MSEFSSFPQSPFWVRTGWGKVDGYSVVSITGFNNNVLQNTPTSLCPNFAGQYVFPPTASIMTVSSTVATDTAAGIGARAVLVEGLDSNYDRISEIVALNGQTGVNTTRQYLRINSATVVSVGSNGANGGTVYVGSGTITAGVPANKYAIIPVGYNLDQCSNYTIPRNHTGFLVEATGSAVATGTNQRTVFFTRIGTPGVPFLRYTGFCVQGNVGGPTITWPGGVPEKSDTDALAETTDTATYATGLFKWLIIRNDAQI
jgi:hypothetical protein